MQSADIPIEALSYFSFPRCTWECNARTVFVKGVCRASPESAAYAHEKAAPASGSHGDHGSQESVPDEGMFL